VAGVVRGDCAAQQVVQPGAELGPQERLAQVIVGARGVRGDDPPVVDVRADHHDGQRRGRRIGAQPAAQLDAEVTGHPHVEQYGVEVGTRGLSMGGLGGGSSSTQICSARSQAR
jgi:hypothetical protein